MSNVSKWNILAGNNTDPPPDGAPEHMLRSAVNNCMREMMAAVARWYGDAKPTLQATVSVNAYSLATNSAYVAFTDMPILVFRAPASTNTGALTLNVDGLGAKPFYKSTGNVPFGAGDVIASQVMMVAYNPAANTGVGGFELVGPRASRDTFPSGTVMIFQQAAPPVGWTGLTNNDMALRMVNVAGGLGGTLGGTTPVSVVFAPRTIDITNLPNASLSVASITMGGSGNHSHQTPAGAAGTGGGQFDNFLVGGNSVGRVDANATGARSTFNQVNADAAPNTGPAGNHTHTLGGSIPLNGGVTQVAMDFSVQYINVIAATRQ